MYQPLCLWACTCTHYSVASYRKILEFSLWLSSCSISSSTHYLNRGFLSNIVNHPSKLISTVGRLARTAVNSRQVLFSINNFRASGAECVWGLSRVLPTTRAFFFGSWHDQYFIRRLFTNITTCARKTHEEYQSYHCIFIGFAGAPFSSFLLPALVKLVTLRE